VDWRDAMRVKGGGGNPTMIIVIVVLVVLILAVLGYILFLMPK
jgi:flagellar basal body-associated protein FliL